MHSLLSDTFIIVCVLQTTQSQCRNKKLLFLEYFRLTVKQYNSDTTVIHQLMRDYLYTVESIELNDSPSFIPISRSCNTMLCENIILALKIGLFLGRTLISEFPTCGTLIPENWRWPPKKAKFCGQKSENECRKKKSFPESIWTRTFCKKRDPNWPFLASTAPFTIYHPPIGGSHRVLYFTTQMTEKYSTAMC